MDDNEPQRNQPAQSGPVTISDWVACLNSNDNQIVLSCTVTAADASAGITGVGLILNNEKGAILASVYTSFSGESETAFPAINLPANSLGVGSDVLAVVQGECGGKHYFFEENLSVTQC